MLPEPEAEPTPCWHEGHFLVQTYRCHRYNGLYSHAAPATCKSSLEFHRFIGFVVSSTSPVLKQFLNVCAYTRLHLFVLESTPRFNYKSWETRSQSSGAEWKWRWPSWGSPSLIIRMVSVDMKQHWTWTRQQVTTEATKPHNFRENNLLTFPVSLWTKSYSSCRRSPQQATSRNWPVNLEH